MTTWNEITPKSILRRGKRIDSWFVSHYGMNLYRGCEHNCVYCDGRAEKYDVKGEFGEQIAIKTNAVEVLARELDPARKRKPLPRSFVLIGGGVGDAYQPVEGEYRLTRRVLKQIDQYGLPTHILTKSALVRRDCDILKRIDERSRAIVSMSFSSADDELGRILEPGCTPASERLQTLSFFKAAGIATGVFFMPVVPGITDDLGTLDTTMRRISEAGVDFVIFGGMTLKEGRQRQHAFAFLADHFPHLLPMYELLYPGNKWGRAQPEYEAGLSRILFELARKYRLPLRIPSRLWSDLVSENDRVIVTLEHIDYLLKLQGKGRTPFGYAAYTMSQQDRPLVELRHELSTLSGIGKTTERLITEVLDTGHCRYLDTLLMGETRIGA